MHFSLLIAGAMATSSALPFAPMRQDGIYCSGRLLEAVQMSRLFNDSKHFVDMPLKAEPETVLGAFEQRFNASQPPPSKAELASFVAAYFDTPGSELQPAEPADWTPKPKLFSLLSDSATLEFAQFLNEQWKELGRKQVDEVAHSPQRFSSIPLPHPFVVAGGRFREVYYWDSYWITKGLLAVDMNQTALGMLLNLVSLIERFGFVPNGGRVYYRTRSQPPVASLIAEALFDQGTLQDRSLLQKTVLPALDAEYAWFMANRSVQVKNSSAASALTLNRYFSSAELALNSAPRPESYYEDRTLADTLSANRSKAALYRELRAGAESGWDYSSRWIRTSKGQQEQELGGEGTEGTEGNEQKEEESIFNGDTWPLRDIAIQSVIPVCLNAILCRVESALAKLHAYADADAEPDTDSTLEPECSDQAKAADDAATKIDSKLTSAAAYHARAEARRQAMASLMWDDATAQWRDIDTVSLRFVHASRSGDKSGEDGSSTRYSYASNLMGLWAGVPLPEPTERSAQRVIAAIASSSLRHAGGFSTGDTPQPTGQQWDFPNAWPPLQWFVVEGLQELAGGLRRKQIVDKGGQVDAHGEGADVQAQAQQRQQRQQQLAEAALSAGSLAEEIGCSWVRDVCLRGFQKHKTMFEKYDATRPGETGAGGEYAPQTGFGWTNGVALDFIRSFPCARGPPPR